MTKNSIVIWITSVAAILSSIGVIYTSIDPIIENVKEYILIKQKVDSLDERYKRLSRHIPIFTDHVDTLHVITKRLEKHRANSFSIGFRIRREDNQLLYITRDGDSEVIYENDTSCWYINNYGQKKQLPCPH